MSDLIFLKLGGSLLTDKAAVEALRPGVLSRLALEIQQALAGREKLRLVIGHGSGSFGHVAASKFGTRQGVHSPDEWLGFVEVSSAAARLNGIVREAMLESGVPAVTFQPSASAVCVDGEIVAMAVEQIQKALAEGLVPLLYGDVAIDRNRGGTIISTEEILSYLAPHLEPQRFLLAGETDGVTDIKGQTIPLITGANIDTIRSQLGQSRGTDVTGGMAGKVSDMLALSRSQPTMGIHIFSGLVDGAVLRSLTGKELTLGTTIAP